jgi:cellobiose phosphorylase
MLRYLVRKWKAVRPGQWRPPQHIEQPLRSELYSAEQMEQHGEVLAESHRDARAHGADRLLPRLAENEVVLVHACKLLAEAIEGERRITPAGEWLLDNFYLIEEQIRTARRHLPKRYSWELPRLTSGPSAGFPRVYDIALEAISHGDGRVDTDSLIGFVSAYQRGTTLALGELWAIPIMLRLALIENLRRVAERIAADRTHRNLADAWADQIVDYAETDAKNLILVVADMARSNPPMVSAFVAELTRRLQGHGPALALPLTWIEQSLAESGLTIAQLVQAENQRQAADQVSISNSIGSMRLLAVMDWREFVESMSVVDRTLRHDPAGIYAQMDFATRDRYRHAIEETAKRGNFAETRIAEAALHLAGEAAAGDSADTRAAHVGYYLIDAGLAQLESAVQLRSPLRALARDRHLRVSLYLGAIALITVVATVVACLAAHAYGVRGWLLASLAVCTALGASQLGVAIVNRLASMLVAPRALPRMDFSAGVPPQAQTLVVVPTLLGSAESAAALIESLEVRFLANRDKHVQFGLLTDFADAAEETLAEDEPILRAAAHGIEQLNRKYGDDAGDSAFFLFHRPRRWNAQERVWMGHERKRGKLGDLNALLRGSPVRAFSLIVGDVSLLQSVKYVITLDTDTLLPRDAARELIAGMAHPLNRAVHDAAKGRVDTGYGILQPRVGATLPSTQRSRYARLHAGDAGIDPYTRAVSDVYQDVFGEGSFIGKGIYDVDAFELSLAQRLPENRILSHDLLEGCYARSGLLSDVELYESYPSSYHADVQRRHRWIRGDWQIAHWLLPRVPGADGAATKNPLSSLSRWKVLDNLRRSLVPVALTVLMLLGWIVLPAPWLWTLAVLGLTFVPALGAALLELARKPRECLLRHHVDTSLRAAGRRFANALFALACLPHEAYFCLDAIVRTGVRMLITQHHLLQWTASSEVDRNARTSIAASFRSMWFAPALAVATMLCLLHARPLALATASPVLLLWLAGPLIEWWLSRPIETAVETFDADEIAFLRRTARRTWAFFEHLQTAEDNWLPPDNIQEQPAIVVAHRTSPTNIGLALLSNLSAYDFGYVSVGSVIERCERTLDALAKLQRERGHFYNWYDTRTLQPLAPLYVSTVDSGNLCAHLFTLHAGLCALLDQAIGNPRTLEGLRDTLGVLIETAPAEHRAVVEQFRLRLDQICTQATMTLAAMLRALAELESAAAAIVGGLGEAAGGGSAVWANALLNQCRDAANDLRFLAPWLELPPAPGALADVLETAALPTLRELPQHAHDLLQAVQQRATSAAEPQHGRWIDDFARHVAEAGRRAHARIAAIERSALHVRQFAQMDFTFLYDAERRLFTIGFNVSDRRPDVSYYDLLASEARLGNFVAIALGQVPQESWFALGRLLTSTGHEPALLSWGGSMFEYLMPLLVMPSYPDTLLDQTCKAVVRRQIEYGRQRHAPWGISESGYNSVDASHSYQYRAFGVPGLGLKRGLAEDLVVTPHATALALMIAPHAATRNLLAMAAQGLLGRFGFFEAADYTPVRLRRGETFAVVQSFMAHHQGMSLLAFADVLLDRPMRSRFVSEPAFQATLQLLQERIPRASATFTHSTELVDRRAAADVAEMPVRVFATAGTRIPAVQMLSNGRYHVMLTNAGGGYSRWRDLALTRWREDSTCDNWGTFCYIRDADSGEVWSNALQPTLAPAGSYEAIFTEPRVEFRRRDGDIDTNTDVAVSPEDDVEVRRVRITNRSRVRRTIEVTSYAEVVLAPAMADAMHRVFSNLFVETEMLHPRPAILCSRRPRADDEHWPWLLHTLALHGPDSTATSFETDRARFIGRGNSVADPAAMRTAEPLSGTCGPVLDPIVAIRHRFTLEPEQSATLNMVTGVGESRAACIALVEKYQDLHLADRVFDLAWTHSQVALRQINVTETDAQLYGRLAGRVLYANNSLRADPTLIAGNRRGQSGLWGYAISGDLPIVLLQIRDAANIELVRQLVRAHAYWRSKGFAVDLIIWNDDRGGYRQALQDEILGLIAAGVEANIIDRPGGIFVRAAEQIAAEDRILLQAIARAIISDARGGLPEQIKRSDLLELPIPRLLTTAAERSEVPATPAAPRELILGNGLGGFSTDGREYVITTQRGAMTPAPWVNVLANPEFGTVVSESGSAYTWAENAHEYRLSPWHNDPVGDPSGEAFYVRDEESGRFWSPTPLPCCGETPYTTRHGFGYSLFEHTEDGIRTELWTYVALDAAVKFSVVRVRNLSGRPRRLSITGYIEWVLGDMRPKAAMHVVTEIDANGGALLARNAFNPEFADRVAFFDVDEATRTLSGDRAEFIGRNGTLKRPAALLRARLSGKVGAAMDPCAAIHVPFDLGDSQSREVIFRLGAGHGVDNTSNLVQRFRKAGTARAALDAVREYWRRTLGTLQVQTGQPALDVLTNGWLLYQVIACRLWGRSGFYQSGGAFGFRDQLQDAMALVHAAPSLLREQLLRCASRQFKEGDVQHWWHPPSGRGVRTHCSDDYLWLPLAAWRYVSCTGDRDVLAERSAFLEGRMVREGEESYYDLPLQSAEIADLYEHCARAIRHALRFGAHGLPLMGSGDWNDGMNNVGLHGKGESVWLAFFLHHVLTRFADVAVLRDDASFATQCRGEAMRLRAQIERHAWDGAWYRRAYFDDGTPLGTSAGTECQIDSIAQSWSVLSGAGEAARVHSAMNALDQRLVDREHALIKLLDPPFDKSKPDPGYIKGYLPGVRENGGQYTHAGIWASMAFAALGDGQRACELLEMLNPINHSLSPDAASRYKVEPYVVAADVYAKAPHVGRGGWSWYTGSAGWLYRLITESILGLQLEGDRLRMAPCIPRSWNGFTVIYRHRETPYEIVVVRAAAAAPLRLLLDGQEQADSSIALVNDGLPHVVNLSLAGA